ncbi:hypothetical protein HY004_02555 [Candidatus Saccharibacteria bacterium]|nr:hypothetical protein [Candidatus Saccharibacteria bacterium]
MHKHKIWPAALVAVVLSLVMASSAMADPPFPDYNKTAATGETVTYDVAAENPSLGVTGVAFVLGGSCFTSGPTSVTYTMYSTTPGYSETCKIAVNYSGGFGVADFVISLASAADTQAPVVDITSPTDGSTVSASPVTLNYTATDDVGVTSCSASDGTPVTLVEGDNPIIVTCNDAAGNVGSDTVHVNYVPPDTQAPVVTITAPANGTIFTVSTANLTFGVTDDQDPIPTCDKVSGSDVALSVGSNTIAVNCTDDAGNTGSASVTVTYTPPPDPDRVKIRLGNLTVREGDVNKTAYVPITLSRPYPVPITLSYSTQQAQGRGGATSNVDYVAVENQQVIIPAYQSSWELPVTIIGDNLKESSENFFVIGDLTIESDAFAILVKDKATVVITNDDRSGCNDGFNHGHSGHDDNHNGRDDAHE